MGGNNYGIGGMKYGIYTIATNISYLVQVGQSHAVRCLCHTCKRVYGARVSGDSLYGAPMSAFAV